MDLEQVTAAPEVPLLMARCAIQELEEGSEEERGSNQVERKAALTKTRILELALRYRLLSSQTSFIAIEERASSDQVKERAVLQRVPVTLTKGWGGLEDTVLCSRSPQLRKRAIMSAGASPVVLEDRMVDECSFDLMLDADESCDSMMAYEDIASVREKNDADGLQFLIRLQNAKGYFDFENVDVSLLSLDPQQWQELVNVVKGLASENCELVASTLAALVLLETLYEDQRVEWQMIADKAERWLLQQSVTLPSGERSTKDWAKKILMPQAFNPIEKE